MSSIEEIKTKLKSIENITFSKHAELKIRTRRIKKKIILEILKNPEKLEKFAYEEDKYPGEKYELYFPLNKRKGLKIVVSFINQHLNVITVHIILSKRLKMVEKWQKKHL